MRITGGRSKGRILSSLKGLDIRPTSDKVRETIFNLIGQDIRGQRVLDLFAGSGSLGIEALSRGALWTLFIDNSRQSIRLIKKNLALSGFESSGHVLKKDLTKGLPRDHPQIKKHIDLAFIDPPYRKELIPYVLSDLSEKDVLLSSSIVVVEASKTDDLPRSKGKLRLFDTRLYGETKIGIYNYEECK